MKNRSLPNISVEDRAYAESLVIFEDSQVIVFDKPSGLAVQGGGGISRSLDDLLIAFAKSNGKKPRLVHRLDRGTSGVVIVARTKPAAAFLSEEFAARQATKTYLAIVSGKLPVDVEGVFDQPLVKVEEGGRPRMLIAKAERKGAQKALTGWRIRARHGDYALFELKPETGRMHQIRAHLLGAGCPILGDHLYGTGAQSAERLMLHAQSLEIGLPDGTRKLFSAPPPESFVKMAMQIGLSLPD
ncbi:MULTISPECIES: RluA family pseudouridine synthase [unclassified Hyphomonas]|jgi:tRNA pseudouridine32 synthase/23S rRNA pseudouridine746 synthase|uniref:Ribosomal large subunit pseudouridine synthase C n=2 Tax=root TaxID=1 RepID=A0A160TWR5_9ZZZZ|nr:MULTISPECIES: RNA pseudouridine synthase [unclassified Hyphomonas]MAN90627.1 RNA pseudouridine synthase [Hyphomonadaceae bacterium]MAA81065.1 RNA pseudouridine synthase [Hyphomonas sp.]MBG67059.1 RNA pseudouridine synthase [Hyphomonas sp.]MBO6583791.1 RNA pseudouridine synthase [Hyphomonas sp.]MDF1807069.1 RNA pseudouridine synthase [Hyphomonas sp.]|tara:strand:+ start:13770 stop:14498 length:729 start_codon:yes stop_codon:yes gene_type:complete